MQAIFIHNPLELFVYKSSTSYKDMKWILLKTSALNFSICIITKQIGVKTNKDLPWAATAGSAMLASPCSRTSRMRTPSRRATSRWPEWWTSSESWRCPAMKRRSPHVHRRRTPSWRRWPRFWYQYWGSSDLLPINLSSVHVFHCIFSIICCVEFYVGITTT